MQQELTQELEAFTATLMREMLVKRAVQILGNSDSRMWRMLFAHVKAKYVRLSFDNVVWLGADGLNRRTEHKYLTVFSNLMTKRVLFAPPDEEASVREAFAAKLLPHNDHPKTFSMWP